MKFDLAPVVRGRLTAEELPVHQPVHQTDGAVMPELQTFRQLGDGGEFPSGKSLDREQRLMLLCG